MVYKRVRGWTSGGASPYLEYSPLSHFVTKVISVSDENYTFSKKSPEHRIPYILKHVFALF